MLDGRIAIVTGAGRGLGRALALALADAGADLVLAARGADQLAEVAELITDRGRRALAVPTDVTDPTDTAELVARATSEFGRIDVQVNNAGVVIGAPVLDMTDQEWDLVVETNLRGTFNCVRAVGPTFQQAGAGKVINISSSFAFTAVRNYAAYSMTKAALNQLTRVLAREWAPYGIQVNAIAPGYFETDSNAAARSDERVRERIVRRIPAGRFGRPGELGPLAVFLASAASDYVTGETFVIDGGMST